MKKLLAKPLPNTEKHVDLNLLANSFERTRLEMVLIDEPVNVVLNIFI
jgi:hypothetical protein